MISRRSSGCIRAVSAVEPTRSENITVTWRCSAVSSPASSVARGASDTGRDRREFSTARNASSIPGSCMSSQALQNWPATQCWNWLSAGRTDPAPPNTSKSPCQSRLLRKEVEMGCPFAPRRCGKPPHIRLWRCSCRDYPRCRRRYSRGSIPLNQGTNDHTGGVYGRFELARRCSYRAVLEARAAPILVQYRCQRRTCGPIIRRPRVYRKQVGKLSPGFAMPRSIGRVHKPLSAISCHGHWKVPTTHTASMRDTIARLSWVVRGDH